MLRRTVLAACAAEEISVHKPAEDSYVFLGGTAERPHREDAVAGCLWTPQLSEDFRRKQNL